MTTTSALSARYFGIGLIASLGAIAYLSFPAFEDNRNSLVENLGITQSSLSLGVLIIVALLFVFLFIRFQQIATQPLLALIKQTETNRLNSGYSPKSNIMEVNRFRYLLENRSLMIQRLESEIESLKTSNDEFEQRLKLAAKKETEDAAELVEKSTLIKEMRFEQIRLEEGIKRLEVMLDQERKAKVGEEIEKRSDEIYSQMERAVEASAYKALWFPQIFQDLKTPASIIHETLENLDQNWESSSFARLKSDIETLNTQSDQLIRLLDQLTGKTARSLENEREESPGVIAEFPKPTASDEESSSEDAINK